MGKELKNYRGFTLIELMMTLVIAGILLTVAVPSFSEMIKNSRLTTEINELVTILNYGRTEAIKRGVDVTVCKSNTGTSCAGNWEDGWVAFVDLNDDGAIDTGETILRIHGALSTGNTLAFPRNRISYSAQGFAVGFTGTFVLCDDRGAPEAKGEVISNTGRARKAVDSDTDGTVEDGSGNNVTCP